MKCIQACGFWGLFRIVAAESLCIVLISCIELVNSSHASLLLFYCSLHDLLHFHLHFMFVLIRPIVWLIDSLTCFPLPVLSEHNSYCPNFCRKEHKCLRQWKACGSAGVSMSTSTSTSFSSKRSEVHFEGMFPRPMSEINLFVLVCSVEVI